MKDIELLPFDAMAVSRGPRRFAIVVEIEPTIEGGNLKVVGGAPSIVVRELGDRHGPLIMLTWDEARNLANCLEQVANVAEFG
jgi:hypothetical protein